MKTEWDFEPLLKKDFKEEREKIKKAYFGFRDKWKENKGYLEKPEVLKEAMDEYENLLKHYSGGGDEGYYYHLREEKEQDNSEIRAKTGNINEFSRKMDNEIKFFELKLSKISKLKQEEFLNSDFLNDYKHYLEKLFLNSKYFLKEGEEKIMSLKENSSYNLWTKMVSSLLLKETRQVLDESGKKVSKTYPEMISLMKSANKKVRDFSAKAFNEILDKYAEVAEFEFNAILEYKKINDEIRLFERPDTSRHIKDDIETKIVDSLVDSITKKFYISKKFYELKSKLLNLPKLKYYERAAEYGEVSKEYSFQDSIKIIKKVFRSLDKEFEDIVNKYLDKGLIDAFPKKGKNGGCFLCPLFYKTSNLYFT